MLPSLATYLDANAGSRVHPEVGARLAGLLQEQANHEVFLGANPSSRHSCGRQAAKLVSAARRSVALSLGCSPENLIFTSSGTESNQLAIRAVLEAEKNPHWITTAVEHESVLRMREWLLARGGSVSLLPVDSAGAPVASALSGLIRPETALVSVIWVGNETGVISDAGALAGACRAQGVPLHLDAAQVWGKLPVNLEELGVDYASFSAHKIGALSGVGVVYARSRRVAPLFLGRQESGRRGGTENVLGIFAAGIAAEIATNARAFEHQREIEALRDRLENKIRERIEGVRINGAGAPRVSNTLSLAFEGVESDGLVAALDHAGFCVSAGSACASGTPAPSHVLLALGLSPELAAGALRVSLPSDADWKSLSAFVDALDAAIARFRGHLSTRAPGASRRAGI